MTTLDPNLVGGLHVEAQQGDDPAALRRSAEAFESMLLQTMLREMREAQLENGFFGQSAGSSIYEGMFETSLSEDLSKGSPLGIADALMKEWQRRPKGEAAPAPTELEGKIRKLRAGRQYGAVLEASRGSGTVVVSPPAGPATQPVAKPVAAVAQPVHRPEVHRHDAQRDHVHRHDGVSSDFGWRKDPIDGTRRFHAGVDLPAPAGTPVVSVAPGRVVEAGEASGYGLQVTIEHADGWTSRYAHLSSIEVSPGDRIPRGAHLGQVGSTGRSTGPHLHFETARFGEPVDPAKAAPGPIRTQVLAPPADKSGEHRALRGN